MNHSPDPRQARIAHQSRSSQVRLWHCTHLFVCRVGLHAQARGQFLTSKGDHVCVGCRGVAAAAAYALTASALCCLSSLRAAGSCAVWGGQLSKGKGAL